MKNVYERGNIMKEKKKCTDFIRNQRFKDIFIRSKERKEIIEKYVLISLFYQESKIKEFFQKLVGSRGN